MKVDLPRQVQELASPQAEPANLLASLPFEIGLRAFGRSWAIRAEILAALETGAPTLYRIAADYGVSHQYVSKLAKRVKGIRNAGDAQLTAAKG